MARPSDNALQYFSFDTKDQDNLQYVEVLHKHEGFAIVIKLFQHIYGGPGGYYCEWNDINKHLFCKKSGTTLEVLDGVIGTCCGAEVGIFDANMVHQHHILTSDGIQKRWLKIVRQSGRKNAHIIDKYRLIEIDSATAAVVSTTNAPDETPPTLVDGTTETPQSKVKYSIVNESNIEGNGTIPTPPGDDLEIGKGKKVSTRKPAPPFPETAKEVENYMYQKTKNRWDPGFSNLQAQKFFNHYTANNWKQSKGNKIVNWHAAANMWIFRELEKGSLGQPQKAQDAPTPAPVAPKQTPPPVVLSPEQIEKKTIDFTESIYQEFIAGTVKEDGLPSSIYDMLRDKGLLVLSDTQKQDILKQCEFSEVKAKKKAIANYFKQLREQGALSVYVLEVV